MIFYFQKFDFIYLLYYSSFWIVTRILVFSKILSNMATLPNFYLSANFLNLSGIMVLIRFQSQLQFSSLWLSQSGRSLSRFNSDSTNCTSSLTVSPSYWETLTTLTSLNFMYSFSPRKSFLRYFELRLFWEASISCPLKTIH